MVCGPFSDNKGAIQVIRAKSLEALQELIREDPFIRDEYYKNVDIHEFFEASQENHWLLEASQTRHNLEANNSEEV